MKLSDLMGGAGPNQTRLRQEIFALGGRHLGDALAGARAELQDPNLTPERRRLLRAVVKHLAAGKGLPGVVGSGAPATLPSPPVRLVNAGYVAVLIGAAIWVAMIVRALVT